jgi:hypothetical protein
MSLDRQHPDGTHYQTPVLLPLDYTLGGYDKSLRDPAYFVVTNITKEYIDLETSQGKMRLKTYNDFLKAFKKHKTNWIGCSSLTCFLRWFSIKQIIAAESPFNKPIEKDGHILEGLPELGRYKIDKRSTLNWVNPWIKDDFIPNTLEKVKLVAEKLENLDKVMYVNTVSPSSTSSGTMLHYVKSTEFDFIKLLDPKEVDLIYKCYYPLKQENNYIGLLGDSIVSIDANRAYFHELYKQMSYSPRYNTVRRDKKNIKAAHAGWAKVVVNMPEEIADPGIPYKDPTTGILAYPVGTFLTYLTKPFIDLLDTLGVEYTILEAVWLIPTSENPGGGFKKFLNLLSLLMDCMSDFYYPINLKVFYFVLIGHMLHIHEELEDITSKTILKTSRDFQPCIASMVASGVSCEVYRLQMSAEEPYFTSADGGGAKSYKYIPTNFKHYSGYGLCFNAGLKDKPGKNPGKNLGKLTSLIETQRSKKALEVRLPYLITPQVAINKPELWGTSRWITRKLRPDCGYRPMESRPKYLGSILDKKFSSRPPTVVQTGEIDYAYNLVREDVRSLSVAQLVKLNKLIDQGGS